MEIEEEVAAVDTNKKRSIATTIPTAKSGQAMLELMIGLVALMAIVAGLLQVASLTRARTDTMVEARAEAGRYSFGGLGLSERPQYIRNIDAGPDGRTYSYDDTRNLAGGGAFHDIIISKATSSPDQWSIMSDLRNTSFSELNNSGNPVSTFGLIKGSSSESIPLSSAVRSLLYRADSIDIKSDVWTTWTQGIY